MGRKSSLKRLQWSQDAMETAYKAVIEDNWPISKAAKVHDVPRMTLSNKIKGKAPLLCNVGRKPVLNETEENSLVRYIVYMAERKYPITREQVIGLAWAVALRDGKDCFRKTGPSLKWWRGFRDRHPDISLRKPEYMDRNKSENATKDVIDSYFDDLETLLVSHDLLVKPHLVFNCDESAICLNKSSQRVLLPKSMKRCQTNNLGPSQHVTVLCCVCASGGTVPPLIVFSKGFPSGRLFVNQGPTNATYSTSESGFVDRAIYTEWFMKNFLRYTPKERPLLLLQDSATAHISPELIDAAISNDVILLCFPPKLTNLLQPLDVAIFRTMKSELSKAMHATKLLRNDMWVSKSNFPGVFKSVFENTFTPALVSRAFQKSGIYPLDRSKVLKELSDDSLNDSKTLNDNTALNSNNNLNDSTSQNDSNITMNNSHTLNDSIMTSEENAEDKCILDLELSVENMDSIPEGAEVLLSGSSSGDSQPCPPEMALQAIENTLTPRKRKLYLTRFSKDMAYNSDAVYTTWRHLKKSVAQPDAQFSGINSTISHPLVKTGLIPERFVDIFPEVPEKKSRVTKPRARVISTEEFRDQLLVKKQRKCKNGDKENKGNTVARKRRQVTKKEEVPKKVPRKQADYDQKRAKYFQDLQAKMKKCSTYAELEIVCETEKEIVENFTLNNLNITTNAKSCLDTVSQSHLMQMPSSEQKKLSDYIPVSVMADGNCLPRSASVLLTGTENLHVEIRVRIAMELVQHKKLYMDNDFLQQESNLTGDTANIYGFLSDMFTSQADTETIYEKEILKVLQPSTYMGIWQLHALASVIQRPVFSVYPRGQTAKYLHRKIMPRCASTKPLVYIMWTTCVPDDSQWYQPNHFVPLIKNEFPDQTKNKEETEQDTDLSVNEGEVQEAEETRSKEKELEQTMNKKQEPEETKNEKQEPEETKNEKQELEETKNDKQEPEETKNEKQEPEETKNDKQEPEKTKNEKQETEETKNDKQEPEETKNDKQEPEVTKNGKQEPEETKNGKQESGQQKNAKESAAFNFKAGTFVAVALETTRKKQKMYFGKVLAFDDSQTAATVSYMEKKRDFYQWPAKEDVSMEPVKNMLSVDPPKFIKVNKRNNTELFTFPEEVQLSARAYFKC